METNPNLLSVLTREGVLIKVSIRFWRGCKKLKPEDIGLKEADLSDRLISLGHKRLLPKDALASLAVLEGRAHALVEGNTFPFLNGLGHFLPNSKLEEVTGTLKEIEAEFWRAKAEFLAKYASLREDAAKEWRTMATKLVKDPDRLTAVIESSFPFAHQMDRYFSFDLQLFQISLPENVSADLVSAGDQHGIVLARQTAAQEASAKLVTLNANDSLANLETAIVQTEQLGFELITFAKAKVGSQPANLATFRRLPPGIAPGPLTLVQEPGTSALPQQETDLNNGETGGKQTISYAIVFVLNNEANVVAYRG